MKRDEATYGGVQKKFDEWTELLANKPPVPRVVAPQRPYTPEPASDNDMGKTVFAAIGFGIGALLLLLAVLALVTAFKWGDYARNGAFVGYSLVAFFLTVAGIGGIAATWNHNFRVLPNAHKRKGHAH